MDKKKTGELIKDARQKKGYTQEDLGDILGVTNKAISRWERGESFPDVALIESIAQALATITGGVFRFSSFNFLIKENPSIFGS